MQMSQSLGRMGQRLWARLRLGPRDRDIAALYALSVQVARVLVRLYRLQEVGGQLCRLQRQSFLLATTNFVCEFALFSMYMYGVYLTVYLTMTVKAMLVFVWTLDVDLSRIGLCVLPKVCDDMHCRWLTLHNSTLCSCTAASILLYLCRFRDHSLQLLATGTPRRMPLRSHLVRFFLSYC